MVDGIQECLDSVKLHHPDCDIRLYTEEDFPAPQHGIVANSDLIRLQKIYEEGGYYIDADCYCLKPLDFYRRVIFGTQDTSTTHPDSIVEWVMGSEPRNPDFKTLLTATEKKLEKGPYNGCAFKEELNQAVSILNYRDMAPEGWAGSRYFAKVNRSFVRPTDPTLVHLFLTSWVAILQNNWPPKWPYIAGWPINKTVRREVEVIKQW